MSATWDIQVYKGSVYVIHGTVNIYISQQEYNCIPSLFISNKSPQVAQHRMLLQQQHISLTLKD